MLGEGAGYGGEMVGGLGMDVAAGIEPDASADAAAASILGLGRSARADSGQS